MDQINFRPPPPKIVKATLVVTERCNLRCWMCDYGASGDRARDLPYAVDDIIGLLEHGVFKNSLKGLTLTGGEPFIRKDIIAMYQALQETHPDLRVNFSTNGTVLEPMGEVLARVRDFRKFGLLVSIDGIEKHDAQRGLEGAFQKTFNNIRELRNRYPRLSVVFKYTITPMNYAELWKTWAFFQKHGFTLTAKLVENNAFYNNKAAYEQNRKDFVFSGNQLLSVREQLKRILAASRFARDRLRRWEIKQVHAATRPGWVRTDRCLTPQSALFIDCDLNVFTCKEYPPVCNLSAGRLDDLSTAGGYGDIIEHQKQNSGKCTHCTSQMKISKKRTPWEKYFTFSSR